MNYLYPEIPWNKIKVVGFDLDGTLYDEFEFISQVYHAIAKKFGKGKKEKAIFNFMLSRWLEKGSSYPFIFDETLEKLKVNRKLREEYINIALSTFRNFKPKITLSERKRFVLSELKKKYKLFLLSNGSTVLQWNKIGALKLENYFDKKNICVSGDYGKDFEKPALLSLGTISVLKNKVKGSEVVYIGDRDVDEKFAANAGFHYLMIQNKI